MLKRDLIYKLEEGRVLFFFLPTETLLVKLVDYWLSEATFFEGSIY